MSMRFYNLTIMLMFATCQVAADNLFVCSGSSHQVLQFDEDTGDEIGPFSFVANPTGITFQTLKSFAGF